MNRIFVRCVDVLFLGGHVDLNFVLSRRFHNTQVCGNLVVAFRSPRDIAKAMSADYHRETLHDELTVRWQTRDMVSFVSENQLQ